VVEQIAGQLLDIARSARPEAFSDPVTAVPTATG
jgi:hypothetical protein